MEELRALLNKADERIEALETAVAFQDKLLQELNGVVTTQQRMLDVLAPQLQELKQQLQTLKEHAGDGVGVSAAHEKPPHY